MIKFDYIRKELGTSNLANKIDLLINGKNDCLLACKFLISYHVEKIKDVNNFLYTESPDLIYTTSYIINKTIYNHELTSNTDYSLKYSIVNILIPAIELREIELLPFIYITSDMDMLLSKYVTYIQTARYYMSNFDKEKVVFDAVSLTTPTSLLYILDVSNIQNSEMFLAHALLNNKHYLCLLPKPTFFTPFKTKYVLTTDNKYFLEIHSLEELNLCLENYTKLTSDKYNSDNIIIV